MRLKALEKAMEEQANCLAATMENLDERAAIQISQFDIFMQQFAALGSLLDQGVDIHSNSCGTMKTVTVPPPVGTPPAISKPLTLSSPPSPPLIATAHMVPYVPAVLTP